MRKFITSLVLSLGLIGLFAGSSAQPAYASVQDFTITNFQADYTLDKSVPGGGLYTKETIEVNFTDNNHGIFRSLPKKYQGLDTRLKIKSVMRDGTKEDYTTSTQNDNMVLKIGHQDRTITGVHKYEIEYSQERVINFVGDKAEFYWDVNGTQWQQHFDQVGATVRLKDNIMSSGKDLVCYTGAQGQRGQSCMASSRPGEASFSTVGQLTPGQNMTIVVPLDDGQFTPAVIGRYEKLKQNPTAAGIIYFLPSILVMLATFGLWLKYGKDYRSRGVIVPEYEPPKGLTPAEVGMLDDYNIDGRDLSATLIDLAVRGYIKIYEDVKKYWFITSRSYSLELVKNDMAGLKDFEQTILKAVFGDALGVGEIVKVNDLSKTNTDLYEDIKTTKDQLKAHVMGSGGLIESKGYNFAIIVGIVLAIAPMIPLSIMGSDPTAYVMNMVVVVIFWWVFVRHAMRRRSPTGQAINDQIKGLKLYMNTAEKDRLKMLQSTDRPYAEPSKTVELFEKLLPYAVALGVEKTWAKQFDGVLTDSPKWAESNVAAFSGVALASSLGSITTNFSSSFESGGGVSGSSSGGSSGGGGGGGGGGGW